MLTLNEARDRITARGWLAHATPEVQQAVVSRSSLQNFAAGEALYAIGDPPGGMFGLVAGTVKIMVAAGDDGPFVSHLMTPGDWNGYGPAIADGPRIVGLTAGRDCQAFVFPLHAIHELAGRDPGLWRALAQLTLHDLQIAVGAMNDLMSRDHFTRCVASLLRIGGYRHRADPQSQPLWLDVSQAELAGVCNLSRSTVIGFLRRLEAERMIGISYGQIGVLAPERLGALLTRAPGPQ